MDDQVFIDERVEVLAVFDSGIHLCRPLRFKRQNGRVVEIKEIGLRHPVARGHRTLHIFDVSDGGTDYRLEFDSERLIWRLTIEGDRS